MEKQEFLVWLDIVFKALHFDLKKETEKLYKNQKNYYRRQNVGPHQAIFSFCFVEWGV
jgi:hypothetical protein